MIDIIPAAIMYKRIVSVDEFIGFFIKYSQILFNEELFFSSEDFIFIIFISSISQLGDILISYFKRISNIKNTGKIIPGHGGLLDRIDGMIFAFPFSYLIILLGINKWKKK